MNSCLNCKFAEWRRTANGRLHPDQTGRCRWVMPDIKIPSAFYWNGFIGRKEVPAPCGGGFIERDLPHADCPTWEAKE